MSSPRARATTRRRSRGRRAQAGIEATIFMPQDTPVAKVEATQNYGARIELGGEMFDDAYEDARAYAETSGATFVHPFEDERVIAGQGTIGLELVEQLPDVGTIVVPIGGGGLAAGIAIAAKELKPGVRIVGVQAAACAPVAGGEVHGFTIAEGIAVKHPGELTTSILARPARRRRHGHRRGDQQGDRALARAREARGRGRRRGAARRAARGSGRRGGASVVVLLSGGNIDPSLLITVMRHGLTLAGRYLVVRTRIARPARRARQAAHADRAGAREPRLGRAPPRGDPALGRGDRGRAHALDPRRGARARRCSKRCSAGATRSSGCASRRRVQCGGAARRTCLDDGSRAPARASSARS